MSGAAGVLVANHRDGSTLSLQSDRLSSLVTLWEHSGDISMSWFLFLDESGHDHKTMPYEVRGGIALHAGAL